MSSEAPEPRRWYAHTRKGRGPEEWQPLSEHLDNVADLAARFAAAFDSAAWARLAGSLHDLGKYAADFQKKLLDAYQDPAVLDASVLDGLDERTSQKRVDHSSAGAVHVYELCKERVSSLGDIPSAESALAMVIAGHHSGLPARQTCEGSFLDLRLKRKEKRDRLEAARSHGEPEIDALLDLKPPALPAMFERAPIAYGKGPKARGCEIALRFEFWTRMLFSCLIDADRLDTEAFDDEERSGIRKDARAEGVGLQDLSDAVDRRLEEVSAQAGAAAAKLPAQARPGAEAVLDLRTDVLAACRQAALRPPGRHSLTVPTGGGKTLAALAFALRHAIKNDLRRVVVVIPFTSIIDQTARIYREAFGDLKHALIEHHSNVDPTRETVHNRLASENWDAPVIVTTSVQFFESLHADRGTAARKIHNVAKSVVVFDEVQSLPHGLREPIFDCLNRLVDDYGVSVLCCTATQPALGLDEVNRNTFPHLADVREVVPDPARLFNVVKSRVTADFTRATAERSWEEVAAELRADANRRALAIVERRDDARDLWKLLEADGAFHLSALMCAEHRRATLAAIAEALKDPDRPCRVVSTTLIEAGVDLDFPVVHRVLGGVDALAQAAGRCNRAGALTDADGRPLPGRLVVFKPTTDAPPGLGLGRSVTEGMLNALGADGLDLFDPRTYRIYFNTYFQNVSVDGRNVMLARKGRDFPEVARRFRMIDEQGQAAVVVPYDGAAKFVRRYRDHPCRDTLRALQPYIVNVPERQLGGLRGEVETIHDQVRWIANARQYDARLGLIVDDVKPRPAADYTFCE